MLQLIKQQIQDKPKVTITYFVKDTRKAGGTYVTTSGNVKKLDEYKNSIVMCDGKEIFVEDVLEIGL